MIAARFVVRKFALKSLCRTLSSSVGSIGSFSDSGTSRMGQSPTKMVPYLDEFGAGAIHNGTSVDVEMDSWSTVQELTASGFTTRQSEIISDLICWILRVRLNEFKRSLVTQPQAEYVHFRSTFQSYLMFSIGFVDNDGNI